MHLASIHVPLIHLHRSAQSEQHPDVAGHHWPKAITLRRSDGLGAPAGTMLCRGQSMKFLRIAGLISVLLLWATALMWATFVFTAHSTFAP